MGSELSLLVITLATVDKSRFLTQPFLRYKGHRADGRVSAMYAGSIIHYREMLKAFRTEDFDYSYMTPQNRFSFMGNGITQLEADGGNLGFYLDM